MQVSVPPTAGPLNPLPIIWEYKTIEEVGLEIKTTSVFGASNPVDNTSKLQSTSTSPVLNWFI